MKHSKIVGISTSCGNTYSVGAQYSKGVLLAGGTSLLLPPVKEADKIEELVELCDGILLTGGVDVDPSEYGEERIAECGNSSSERDEFEIALIKAAMHKDKPVFGVCRGLQILNVAAGGTLWQDIPSQVKDSITHRGTDSDPAKHNVLIQSDELALKLGISDKCFEVNSYHHQAVKTIGEGMEILARAAGDGMIEGIYCPSKKFVLGVQWHPELWVENDKNALALFEAFINAL